MAYNEQLANRIREALVDQPHVEEKTMFKGLCFMVNGKMCLCASGDEMLCRIGPDIFEQALKTNGVRGMIRNGKPLKDFVFLSEEAMRTQKQFDYWVNAAIAFNPRAKATKKKQ
ncbi:MAG: TfoX family protein [Sphingobacteriaceae bacterium]|nr:MAG: TfoX family protein [Sphingobacteriaceae bacterium]